MSPSGSHQPQAHRVHAFHAESPTANWTKSGAPCQIDTKKDCHATPSSYTLFTPKLKLSRPFLFQFNRLLTSLNFSLPHVTHAHPSCHSCDANVLSFQGCSLNHPQYYDTGWLLSKSWKLLAFQQKPKVTNFQRPLLNCSFFTDLQGLENGRWFFPQLSKTFKDRVHPVHAHASILTDSMTWEKAEAKRKAQNSMWRHSISTPKDSPVCTVVNRLEWREINECTNWRA